MQFSRYSVRPLTAALALAGGAVMWSDAWADDPNPYYIGASQAITHDSNVFRTSSNLAQSDTYTSTGLLAGIDQPFGRQRFYANGNVRYNHYNSQSQLDNTSYGLNTGLDLSTVNRLTGGLTYTLNQGLYNAGGANLVQFVGKNLERSQQVAANLSWGLASLLSVDGNANHRSLRYSASSYSFANFDQDAGSLGVTYHPSGLLSGGVAYRPTHGSYPQGGYSFDRHDVDFTASWTPTGQSTVSGRISFGKQKYSNSITNDSVSSGSINWDYKPTGKLGFTLWASRDTGAESSFFNFASNAGGSSTAVGDNSSRTTTISLLTNYLATGKITLTGNLRYAKRNLNNGIVYTGVGSQNLSGTDTNKVYSLAANYQALRNLVFTCTLAHDSRSASGQLSFPYSDNSIGCSGQLTLK